MKKQNENWKLYADSCQSSYEMNPEGMIRRTYKNDGEVQIYPGYLNKYIGYYNLPGAHCLLDMSIRGKIHYVHQMVIHLFGVARPEGKVCVDHIDGNRLNNSIHNLRYTTYYWNLQSPLANQRRSKHNRCHSHRGQKIKATSRHGQVVYFQNGMRAAEALNCSHVLVYNALNRVGSAKRAKGYTLEWVSADEKEAQG